MCYEKLEEKKKLNKIVLKTIERKSDVQGKRVKE